MMRQDLYISSSNHNAEGAFFKVLRMVRADTELKMVLNGKK